jgi:acylpyruvate hydrolase
MKIICIGRNYAEHAAEMKAELPTEPVFFLKPDTALLKKDEAFYYPEFTKDLNYECEIVYKITKPGKHIEEKFAHKYYDSFTLGIDFTARDIQTQCKAKGLPWEKAKAFDSSAPIGEFKLLSDFKNPLSFELRLNGNMVQKGNSGQMIFNIDKVIAYVSQYITLKTGDLIFTGTPEGVGPVKIGDKLEAFAEGQRLLELDVK